jgi:hypothetical protein
VRHERKTAPSDYRYKKHVDDGTGEEPDPVAGTLQEIEHVFGVMKLKFGFHEGALPRTSEERQSSQKPRPNSTGFLSKRRFT